MKEKQLKAALVAINAQYIHTGLGARSIAAYLRRELDVEVELLEYTINQHEEELLRGLFECHADVYLFSCYLWNIEIIRRLTRDLRQLCPAARFALGGPQVGYRGAHYLRAMPEVDWVIAGEGEEAVRCLLECLLEEKPVEGCPGLVFRKGQAVAEAPPAKPVSMDALAFPYPDLSDIGSRIVYYESMRGCPYACSYCTSSIERGVRKKSLPLVFEELAEFLRFRLPQVKWVDRTFNCDRERALEIWRWLVKHDNGVSNFHFELSGELLDAETLRFLAGVRPGLFQFEIGVQSTCQETLAEIDRPSNPERLLENVRRLLIPGNIHVHLDLIAGLPYEDYSRFQRSFQEVYACSPHQLQLGILKVLPGSKMERLAEEYGLVSSQSAPFEILFNRWLDYDQLGALQGVAGMVDIYHNSFRFSHTLRHIIPLFPNPFAFFHSLWEYYSAYAAGKPLSRAGQYDVLEGFLSSRGIPVTETIRWLAKYDMLLHEKPRKLPRWMAVTLPGDYRKEIQGFFRNPEAMRAYLPEYEAEGSLRAERMAHMEVFPFHPDTGEPGKAAILFNYRRRDIAGLATARALPPELLGWEKA